MYTDWHLHVTRFKHANLSYVDACPLVMHEPSKVQLISPHLSSPLASVCYLDPLSTAVREPQRIPYVDYRLEGSVGEDAGIQEGLLFQTLLTQAPQSRHLCDRSV
jgi:hypothetical protein